MFIFTDFKKFYKLKIDQNCDKASRWNWYVYLGKPLEVHIQVCRKNYLILCLDKEINFKKSGSVSILRLGRKLNHPRRDRLSSSVRTIYLFLVNILKFKFSGNLVQECVPPVSKRPRPSKLRYKNTKKIKNFVKMMYLKLKLKSMMSLKPKLKSMMMMKVMIVWMMSMTVWNMMMRMEHGNGWRRKPRWQWINVAFQNIPLGLATENKEDIIERIINSYRPHVLGIAEPRTSELSRMFFAGYSLVPGTAIGVTDCRLNVLVKDGLSVEFQNMDTDIPSLVIKIGQAKVIMAYREWRKDGEEGTDSFPQQEERWKPFVEKWRRMKGRVNVVGDMNFEYWRLDTAHHRNCQGLKKEVMEKIIPQGYVQCIREDTRYQGRNSSCLDHVYTNNAQYLDNITNKSATAYDHNLIAFKMMLHSPVFHPQSLIMRNVKSLCPQKFQQEFQELDHDDFLLEPEVGSKVRILVEKVTRILDMLAPVRKINITKRHAKYLNKELIDQIKERDELRRVAERSRNEEDWQRFKVYRNQLRGRLKVAKKKYLSDEIIKADSKDMWRILRESSGLQTKKSSQIQLKIGDEVVKEPERVADELSRYYVEKVEKIVEEHPPNPQLSQVYTDRYLRGKTVPNFNFQHVSVPDVVKIIYDLKTTNATGEDGISVALLKKLSYSLAFFLTVIVNECISQAVYPDQFKYGIISPVPKPGDPMDKKSWRPVTILNAMSKVVEKVLDKQLKHHLVSNGF